MTDFFACNTIALGQNKSFYLSQRFKCSCKYLTYKEWKPSCFVTVVILTSCKYLTYKEWKRVLVGLTISLNSYSVSTLPIRNGNKVTTKKLSSSQRLSKYLTYKEWKHHSSFVLTRHAAICKYLTYKEWELSHNFLSTVVFSSVSTLPIRNGNNI